MFNLLRRHFLLGALTIAPFAVTAYLIFVVGSWFDSQFQPLIQLFFAKALGFNEFYLPGLGIVLGIISVVLVGWLAPSFLGRQTFSASEKVIGRIPLVKAIFAASKQVFDGFTTGNNKDKFRRVVAVPFPSPGSYSLGFVTADREGGWFPGKPDVKLAFFVPTTPLPTGGFLIFFNEADTISLPLSVEDGIKLVVSAALAQPGARHVDVSVHESQQAK